MQVNTYTFESFSPRDFFNEAQFLKIAEFFKYSIFRFWEMGIKNVYKMYDSL